MKGYAKNFIKCQAKNLIITYRYSAFYIDRDKNWFKNKVQNKKWKVVESLT
jgi:hypothetical protein